MDESYSVSPYKPAEVMLVVGEEAAEAFSDYVYANPDVPARTGELIAHMHGSHPELADVVITVIEGMDIDGHEEPFMEGYHAAYKLLGCQAINAQTKLPTVDTLVVSGYLGGLDIFYEDSQDYFSSRFHAMATTNPGMYRCLMKYIEGQDQFRDISNRYHFLLGATALHDIVYQQVALNEQIGRYIQGSIEGPPRVS